MMVLYITTVFITDYPPMSLSTEDFPGRAAAETAGSPDVAPPIDIGETLATFSADLDGFFLQRAVRKAMNRSRTPDTAAIPEIAHETASLRPIEPTTDVAPPLAETTEPGPEPDVPGRYRENVRELKTVALSGLSIAAQAVRREVGEMADVLAERKKEREIAERLKALDIRWNRQFPGGSRHFSGRDIAFEDDTGELSQRRMTQRPKITDLDGNTDPIPINQAGDPVTLFD